jgi:hypothetical protein
MYGIINKSIEELVRSNFGNDCWDRVLTRSEINIDYFLSNEIYDDDITYKLAKSISEELSMSVSEVLYVFGEWWILKTTKEKYGGLLEAGGNDLGNFLKNLPQFHNHIMLIYPKITPPEFKVSNINNNSIDIHYYSKRLGLEDFAKGLLSGLSKLFNTETTITHLKSRIDEEDCEIFNVKW